MYVWRYSSDLQVTFRQADSTWWTSESCMLVTKILDFKTQGCAERQNVTLLFGNKFHISIVQLTLDITKYISFSFSTFIGRLSLDNNFYLDVNFQHLSRGFPSLIRLENAEDSGSAITI